MDEDNSAKAPVTRLRRRLSAEATEEKSSTPNTPTKKRGNPHKPQLDLIDENAVTQQTITPKRVTRRTTKDALETVEDKPLTPLRRSARVKSNTSIASDTAITTSGDTTRAKRVTRSSQLGSDNETPLTPTRQIRRTRKDSTSNSDKGESDKPVCQIYEIIDEESEILDKGLSTPPNSLMLMKNKENSDTVNEKIDRKLDNNVCNTSTIKSNKNESLVSTTLSLNLQKENISPAPKHIIMENLSPCTIQLLRNLDVEKYSSINALNKTTSFTETNVKPYKKITKSWSTICATPEEALEYKQIDINKSQPQMCNSSVLNINKSKDVSSEELLNMDPSEVSKPEIIIEEFTLSGLIQNFQNTEDQIVPVDTSSPNINASINESKMNKDVVVSNSEKVSNDSVEPMDIDQTIPEENESSVNNSVNITSRKNSIEPESKRKSSISQIIYAENKNTLLLTQLNENVLGKSPLLSDTASSSKFLVVDLDRTQTVENEQKKLSVNCLTSTPLQEKHFNKLLAPMNASNIKSYDNNHDSRKSSSIVNSPIVTSSIDKNKDNEFLQEKSGFVQKQRCDENTFGNKSTAISPQMNSIDRHKTNDKDDDSPDDINMTLSEKASDKSVSNQINNKSKESKTVMNDETSIDMTLKDEDLSKLKDKSSASESKKGYTETKISVTEEPSDSDTSNNSSIPKNDLLNYEAEDAGDDYESGDSQNEDEHQYAKENEIIYGDVTLTSEEDFSNDLDYEKDSFVVSSDEDDNQLLDDTEDNLSMSDNELKMTAKSKNKYNKRMIKEQKKASKEMYESRHKLNIKKKKLEENNDSKSDVSNHSPKQRKKNNRMRLDSSEETSVLFENKKWDTQDEKLLTESVVNDSCMDEKEITQINKVTLQENDALTTSMKIDPTSPKNDKDQVNATLDFISGQADLKSSSNVSKSNVDRDDNSNDPSDPHDETSSDDSETIDIINNYDSVLKDLNKANSIKNVDTSLNLELKKRLKNKRASIIDELNLTQFETRKMKKEDLLRLQNTRKQNKASNKSVSVKESEDSPDSVDLRLIFSEESNTDSIYTKNSDDKNAIPLKQGEAKTDLRIEEVSEHTQCASDDIFFIDTIGNRKSDDEATENVNFENTATAKTPKSEKKKKNLSESQPDNLELKNQQKQKLSDNYDKPTEEKITEEQDTENVKTPKSEKKKKLSESRADDDVPPKEEKIMKELDSSKIKTPKSDKKKKQKLSESEAAPIEEIVVSDLDNSSAKTLRSDKKKKQKLSKSQTMQELDSSYTKATKSDKKKRQELTDSQANIQELDSSNANTSKNDKKKKLSEEHEYIQSMPNEEMVIVEIDSFNVKNPKIDKKKNRKLSGSKADIFEDVPTEEIIIKELNSSNLKISKSDKKKNRKLSESKADIFEDVPTEEIIIKELNSSNLKISKSDKKKKQKLSKSKAGIKDIQTEEIIIKELVVSSNTGIPINDKKKKLMLSGVQGDNVEVISTENKQESETSMAGTSKKDKKKKKEMIEILADNVEAGQSLSENGDKKKRKRSPTVPTEEIMGNIILQNNGNEKKKRKITDDGGTIKAVEVKKNKKRKEREDDEHHTQKIQPTGKMTVPRLPTSVVTQLADKPKILVKKKSKVISTSQFIVEDSRRTKPSNYLEESVYLNDDSPQKKKPKKNIPKVLPTMPSSSTSEHGFTNTFKINVLPAETKFVAQATNNITNFKENRLYDKIQRRGTYEHYKKQRSTKLSKF